MSRQPFSCTAHEMFLETRRDFGEPASPGTEARDVPTFIEQKNVLYHFVRRPS